MGHASFAWLTVFRAAESPRAWRRSAPGCFRWPASPETRPPARAAPEILRETRSVRTQIGSNIFQIWHHFTLQRFFLWFCFWYWGIFRYLIQWRYSRDWRWDIFLPIKYIPVICVICFWREVIDVKGSMNKLRIVHLLFLGFRYDINLRRTGSVSLNESPTKAPLKVNSRFITSMSTSTFSTLFIHE